MLTHRMNGLERETRHSGCLTNSIFTTSGSLPRYLVPQGRILGEDCQTLVTLYFVPPIDFEISKPRSVLDFDLFVDSHFEIPGIVPADSFCQEGKYPQSPQCMLYLPIYHPARSCAVCRRFLLCKLSSTDIIVAAGRARWGQTVTGWLSGFHHCPQACES